MPFFKPKPPPKQWDELARIEIREHGGTGVPITMLLVGSILMLAVVIVDNSAVRLAAWGTVWTGWNVLWGVFAAITRRISYVVIREADDSAQDR